MAHMPEPVAPDTKKPSLTERKAGVPAPEQAGSEGDILSRSAQRLVSRSTLTRLQARAGNQAVTALVSRSIVQRDPPPTTAPTSAITIADLDKELGAFITSKDKVVDIISKLSTPDKQTVLAGYKGKLAHALDFAHMKQATINLGASLPVKLDWMQAAAFLTSGIAYSEIRDLITAAPQGDRDMLKNERFKSFFVSVCDNTTIFTAVDDLHFDIETKINWIRAEASALMSLTLAKMKPLLTSASPTDLAAVSSDSWLKFWMDVCTNATMAELVDIFFPNDLTKKLKWMAAEGTNVQLIRAKIAATTDPAEKLALYANPDIRKLMVSECNNAEMIQMVIDLGGTWNQQKEWVLAEGASQHKLASALVAQGKITDPAVVAFVNGLAGVADKEQEYLRNLPDGALASLKKDSMAADVIHEEFGSKADPVIAALNGQIASGDKTVSTSEKLLAGQATGVFVETEFGGDHRFHITYDRDKVSVDVGISLTPADGDARAASLLPAAKTTWSANILSAWEGVYKFTNPTRTIPLHVNLNLNGGSNSVTVHSGRWVWPALNAGNWFVPDVAQQPGQADAVAKAPIHEFGHLIGNLDEYAVDASHYVAVVGQPAATDPNAVPETDTAGKTRYRNTVSLMGSGTTVEPRHIKNILDFVNQNRQSTEQAFTLTK